MWSQNMGGPSPPQLLHFHPVVGFNGAAPSGHGASRDHAYSNSGRHATISRIGVSTTTHAAHSPAAALQEIQRDGRHDSPMPIRGGHQHQAHHPSNHTDPNLTQIRNFPTMELLNSGDPGSGGPSYTTTSPSAQPVEPIIDEKTKRRWSGMKDMQDPLDLMDDKQLIAHVTDLFAQFNAAREKEDKDVESLSKTREAAEERHRFVSERLTQLKARFASSKTQTEQTTEKLAMFQGTSEVELEQAQLEEVCDSLNKARDKVTVEKALYNAQEHPAVEEKEDPPWISKEEQINFEVPQLPVVLTDSYNTTEQIVQKLISSLQKLLRKEQRTLADVSIDTSHLHRVQGEHEALIKAYDAEVEAVKKVEAEGEQTAKTLSYLTGDENLNHLNLDELKKLSDDINIYLRKVTLSLAMKQICNMPQNSMLAHIGATKDKDVCAICYEHNWDTTLTPCGHVMCNSCAARLNICPSCRVRITGKQKMFVQ